MALPYLREPDGVVVDFQNGINDERVAEVAGRHRSLGCVITISAGMYEPGHAMRTDTATIGFKIGEHDGRGHAARARAGRAHQRGGGDQGHDQSLGRALVEARHQLHGQSRSPASPASARSRCARFRRSPPSACTRRGGDRGGPRVGHEVEPIYGIPTQRYVDAYAGQGLAELLADIAEIARTRGGGQPSLLQDVLKRRRTEIDYLNGYVCREGARVGVKTPFNDAVVAIVRGLGVGFQPDRAHLDPVIRMLPASKGS